MRKLHSTEQQDERPSVENQYLKTLAAIKKIAPVQSRHMASNSNSLTNQVNNNHNNEFAVKLTTLNLANFTGLYSEWPSVTK